MKTPSITEYLSKSEVESLCKMASPEEKPDWGKRARIVGSGLLGMAGGTVAGYGAGKLLDLLHGTPIPKAHLNLAAPLVGGAAGLAYNLYKARELEELKRAVKQNPDDKSEGRLPRR